MSNRVFEITITRPNVEVPIWRGLIRDDGCNWVVQVGFEGVYVGSHMLLVKQPYDVHVREIEQAPVDSPLMVE